MAINFDNIYPWSAIEPVTIDGQDMIKIPKFYKKYGAIASGAYQGKKAHWVSETAKSGFHIHPAFVRNGQIMDCFYIGAYEAYNAGNNVAGSKAGQTVWTNLTIENFRSYCAARGTEWHMNNIYELGAIQTLILIELGTPNAISIIGNSTNTNVTTSGTTSITWRGIHELYNCKTEQIDGITSNSNNIYSILKQDGSDTYVSTGIAKPTQGQIQTMCDNVVSGQYDMSDVFVPLSTSTSGTYHADFGVAGNGVILRCSYAAYHGTNLDLFHLFSTYHGGENRSTVTTRIAKYGTSTGVAA